jgi:TolB-like protein/Tfp pilus assembly protein PilF
VFRVGITYIVVAWLVLQVADVVLPILEAPHWVLQVLLASMAVGFLIAVVLAWFYEMTPEGVRREDASAEPRPHDPHAGRRLDFAIIGMLVVAVVYFAWDNVHPGFREARAERQSIAILPFRDLSPAGDQAWFGEGIAEELLNALVRLGGLEVASRTASFALAGPYLDGEVDISGTAARLGVGHILAGSIRTDGSRVRVTAQLIDAAADTPVWSESFDGRMDDIFLIQDQIASRVVEALEVRLGGKALAEAADELTRDPEAYRMYLQGRQLWRQREASSLRQAVDLFQRAVERDPQFHRAWSNMAAAYLSIPDYDKSAAFDEYVALAQSAVDRALAIKPDSSEALTIKAELAIYQCRMVDAAHLFEGAIAANASDPTAHHWYSFNLARYGHVERALEEIRAAKGIDPLITAVISSEADYMLIGGDHEAAAARYREAGALGMGSGENKAVRAEALAGNQANVAGLVDGMEEGLRKEMAARWYAALEDPALVADYIDFLRASGPFEGYFVRGGVSESIAALGSPFLFEFVAAERCGLIPFSVWSERFRPLRATPEFWHWMERWGVVDYWREFGWPDDCESLGAGLAQCPP